LKAKLKERIDAPKLEFISLKDSGHIEKANNFFNTLTSTEQDKLIQKIDELTNKDYNDKI